MRVVGGHLGYGMHGCTVPGRGKPQVRNHLLQLHGELLALGVLLLPLLAELLDGLPPSLRHLIRGAIAVEELCFLNGVLGQNLGGKLEGQGQGVGCHQGQEPLVQERRCAESSHCCQDCHNIILGQADA